MEFDFTKEIKEFDGIPNRCFYYYEEYGAKIHFVSGLPGTGKTELVKSYCLSTRNSYYLSLKDATEKSVVNSLLAQLEVKAESLEDAFAKMREKAGRNAVKIALDDSYCSSILKRKILSLADERMLFIVVKDEYVDKEWTDKKTRLIPRTPADFCKAIHGWDRSDLVRLWAITGGLPSVMKEIDASLSFKDNLKNMIASESSFVTYFSDVIRRYFRSPETYYPVLQAIALGKERISDISKYTGYPNNKCDTYIKNLIENGFVFAAKYGDSKYSTYHIANSYFKFWLLFIQPNLDIIKFSPEKVIAHILEHEDRHVVLPAFKECCIKYIKNYSDANVSDAFGKSYNPATKQVPFNYRGHKLTYDVLLKGRTYTYAFAFPNKLGINPADKSVSFVINAFEEQYGFFLHSELFVFSIYRFKKNALETTSKDIGFHPVVLEQLIKIY